MKITKKEVKTIYTIEISFKEYCDFRHESALQKALGAFEGVDLEDTRLGTIAEEFKKLFDKTKTLQYIVQELGFDGIENYGYHKETEKGCGVHRMTVYNFGDDFN